MSHTFVYVAMLLCCSAITKLESYKLNLEAGMSDLKRTKVCLPIYLDILVGMFAFGDPIRSSRRCINPCRSSECLRIIIFSHENL